MLHDELVCVLGVVSVDSLLNARLGAFQVQTNECGDVGSGYTVEK